ncbi:MAG: DEAD/DEAH box helicase family protein [Cyanobacteria bacterium SBLK]|nr:DEAD/DEAH box helicase family protein [Cyanobacteria bacterium SBLK]
MAILHGSWILNTAESGYFFLWGETWRTKPEDELREGEKIPHHPFAMTRDELLSCPISHLLFERDRAEELVWRQQIIALPSRGEVREKSEDEEKTGRRRKRRSSSTTHSPPPEKDFFPILSGGEGEISGQDITLQWWTVEGIALTAGETVQLLQRLPLGDRSARRGDWGDSLRFWSQVYRWSLDLLARGKFLPGLWEKERGWQSCWQPLLDSAVDRDRLNQFARLMPGMCRVGTLPTTSLHVPQWEDDWVQPQALLLSFLGEIVGAQLRQWLDIPLPPRGDAIAKPWLHSLGRSSPAMSLSSEGLKRLQGAIKNWESPVRDYLVTPDTECLENEQFRVYFHLSPPTEGEIAWGQLDWKLEYGLRSAIDPDCTVSAETIWQNPVDVLVHQEQAIANPQETLLKGLGFAARLYDPIEESLNEGKPTRCLLNPIAVYEFVRASAWQLQDSGFSTIFPPGLGSRSQEKRLGIKIQAKVKQKRGQRLGLKSPLEYQLDLAVGEQSLSAEDFEQLLAQRSPLVEVNGEWLALQPADVRAAQAILSPTKKDELALAVEDALRLSTGDMKTLAKLPVIRFEASGILKDLIANLTENRSLKPLKTPKDFQGELRPYQARGASWLALLEQWSLGACLADDMGLGKCVSGDTVIEVNGKAKIAAEIWEIYAGITEFDGDGLWTKPMQKLEIITLDEGTGEFVKARITRLYRQKVRENLRQVILDEDTSITITYRHKLLTRFGWKNNFVKGEAIAIPTPDSKTIEYREIKAIEPVFYDGWVYDFEVENHHNFIGNGIVCHNTIQAIAFFLNLKEQGGLNAPILLVCPTSVLNNWQRELQKFSPTLFHFIHHGDKRRKGKAFAKFVQNKQLVLTSYSLVYRDIKTLEAVEWEGVVLDEAQNIKNPQSKQSQAVRSLDAGFRLALTGTPVENRLSELWSILDFLNPGFLGTKQFFQRRFAIPIEKYGDRDSLGQLRSLVQPFILRRLKTDKDIVQDLPEKQEMNVFCGLSGEQAQLYQTLVNESLIKIEEAEGIQRHGLILTLLMHLKQVCNHPAQYLKEKTLKRGDRSGKLLRLQEMLEEVVSEGDRALIFTQFAEWGKLLKPYLEKKLETEVPFLYGATRREKRQEIIDRFQNDPDGPQIFLLSLKAGGTGLNLTRANHVFHIDRWWNPAVENQATDRAFRIGQKRNVQVHKFVCTGTLEERIDEMINSKKQLAEQTVDAGEQWLTRLDTEQLRNLLRLEGGVAIDEMEKD